jgi:Na+-driven multidrug efflux pump
MVLFGSANESVYYQEFAVKAFRIYLCMLVPACINKGMFIFLQSLGKAWTSTMLSLMREIVFGVGITLLLPIWFGLNGVLYSMPVSDLLALVFTIVVIIKTVQELNAQMKTMSPVSLVLSQEGE